MALFVSRDALTRTPTIQATSSQVSVRAQWAPRAMFRTENQSAAVVSVRAAPLNATIRNLIDQMPKAISAAINRRVLPVAQAAFDAWPVQTGRSKARLALEISELPGETRLLVRLINRAEYSTEIRQGDTVTELILRPMERALELMADDVAGAIDG